MTLLQEKYTSLLNAAEPTKTLTESLTGSMTVLDWYDASVAISSVSDNGGQASFNFTPGPTLVIGQEVRITGFLVETAYNVNAVITATSAGDFECGLTFTGTEAVGDFEVLTDRVVKLLPEDCYKSLYEDDIQFIEDVKAPFAVDTVQTTDNTITDILSLGATGLADGDYLVKAEVDGFESVAEYAEYHGVCYFTVTSGVAVINASGQNVFFESIAGWGGASFDDATDNDIQLRVQGLGATTIDWTASCTIEAL